MCGRVKTTPLLQQQPQVSRGQTPAQPLLRQKQLLATIRLEALALLGPELNLGGILT